MRFSYSLAVLLFAFGCSGSSEVHYGTASATPDLVEVGPDVQVVADYDVPIFYSDGYYWRYDNGDWYRSNDYAGGFVYAAPPPAVRGIHEPERYVHYRPRGYVAHNRPERRPEPIVRDQRGLNPEVDERGPDNGPPGVNEPGEQRGQPSQQPGNMPPPRDGMPPRPPTRENMPSPPPQPQPPENAPRPQQPENMPTQPPPTRDNMPTPQPPPTRDNMPAPQPPPAHDNMPRPEPPPPRD